MIEVRQLIDPQHLVEIEVDGGVGLKTAPEVIKAGADMLVTGSAFYKSGDYKEFTRKIKAL